MSASPFAIAKLDLPPIVSAGDFDSDIPEASSLGMGSSQETHAVAGEDGQGLEEAAAARAERTAQPVEEQENDAHPLPAGDRVEDEEKTSFGS